MHSVFPEYEIFKFLMFFPIFCVVTWGILANLNGNLRYNYGFLILCVSFLVPAGIILPLAGENAIPWVTGLIFACILMGIPVVIGSYYVGKAVIGFCRLEKKKRIERIQRITGHPEVLYGIMLIFVIAEGVLVYFSYQSTSFRSDFGALVSMIGILPLAYIVSAITMQLNLHTNDIIFNKSQKFKVQVLFLIAMLSLLVILLILAFTLSFLGPAVFTGLISAAISEFLIFLIGILLIQAKYSLEKFGKIGSASANSMLWLGIILPLGVILPILLNQATTRKEKNKIIGIATAFLGLVFMVTVSAVSILYNIYKKRMEKEKLSIKCVENLRKTLASRAVLGGYQVLRGIVDTFAYFNFEGEEFIKLLEDQRTYTWTEVIGKKQERYEKRLVKAEEISENVKLLKTETKIQEKKLSFWLLLNCFNEFSDELLKEDSEEASKIAEEVEIEEIENFQSKVLEIEEEELQRIPVSDKTGFREAAMDSLYSWAYTKSYKNPLQKLNSTVEIQNFMKINEMKQNRTQKKSWFSSVFQHLANEPNEFIKDYWLSENMLFQFIRKSGINEEIIADQQIAAWYADLTVNRRCKPITNKVFFTEVVATLAGMLFKGINPIEAENKLLELIVPELRINIPYIVTENESKKSINHVDILEEALKKPEEKRSEKIIHKKESSSDYLLIDSETSRSISPNKSQTLNRSETLPYVFKSEPSANFQRLQAKFKSMGNSFTGFAQALSKKIETFFYKFYEVKPSNEQKILENTVRISLSEFQTLSDWKDFCAETTNSIKKTVADDSAKNVKIDKIRFNTSNILIILSKVLEVVQLSAIGFKKEISWSIWEKPLATLSNAATLENNSNFVAFFWVSFAISIVYCPFAWYFTPQADKLGRIPDGKEAKCFTIESLKKKMLTLIGGTFYMFILKAQLKVFACDTSLNEPIVYDTEIICYSPYHFVLFCMGFLCILCYYPIATFIFPMLQFNDLKSDLRFQTTYLVVLSQIKLFVTGLSVFLPANMYLEYQLVLVSLSVGFLVIYTIVKRPCLALKFNLWISFGYLCAFLTNVMALVNLNFNGSYLVNLCYFALLGFFLLTTLIIHIFTYCKGKGKVYPES